MEYTLKRHPKRDSDRCGCFSKTGKLGCFLNDVRGSACCGAVFMFDDGGCLGGRESVYYFN